MGFIDPTTRRVYSDGSFTLHRFQVGRCDVCIFVLRDEPRVFIGGGEFGQFGFDSLAREADAVEVAALAERFGVPELHAAAIRMQSVGSAQEAQPGAATDGAIKLSG